MTITKYLSDSKYLLRQASKLLGCSGRAITIDNGIRMVVEDRLILEASRGINSKHIVRSIGAGRFGNEIRTGMARYRLEMDNMTIRIVIVVVTLPTWTHQVWVLPAKQVRYFYRFVRRGIRKNLVAEPPIMEETERNRLWDTTIGFLRYDRKLLAEYNVPRKRGILLHGPPGNGKSMACRWLRWCCARRGLVWETITAEAFNLARMRGGTEDLFESALPGIIALDDLSPELLDRDRESILAGLDGLTVHREVVYIFTSNFHLRHFDPAFRRPGRIDHVVEFPKPDAQLRRAFIENWHSDIKDGINLDQAITDTDGASFAEMEEVKRLLVTRFVETGGWNWTWAYDIFREKRDGSISRPVGFHVAGRGNGRLPHPRRS